MYIATGDTDVLNPGMIFGVTGAIVGWKAASKNKLVWSIVGSVIGSVAAIAVKLGY